MTEPLEFPVDAYRREGLIEPPAAHVGSEPDGSGRVELTFTPADRSVRVPPARPSRC